MAEGCHGDDHRREPWSRRAVAAGGDATARRGRRHPRYGACALLWRAMTRDVLRVRLVSALAIGLLAWCCGGCKQALIQVGVLWDGGYRQARMRMAANEGAPR